MNLLHTLLSGLRDEQVAQLDGISLHGVEQSVFTEILRLRATIEPSKIELLERLGISSSHFDKTCSILIDKVYRHFAPEGGLSLLRLLGRGAQSLDKMYKAEVTKYIHVLKAKSNPLNELKELLESLLRDVPHTMSYMDINKVVAELIVATSSEDDKANMTVYTAAKLLYLDIRKQFAANSLNDKAAYYLDQINALEQSSSNLSDEARGEVLRIKISYYFGISANDLNLCKPLAQQALRLFNDGLFFQAKERAIEIEFTQAELEYYTDNLDGAHDMLEKLYIKYPLHHIPRSHYYLTLSMQLCLILGHTKQARKLFHEIINSFADYTKYKLRDLLTYIKIHVMERDYANAHKYIQHAFGLNEKDQIFQYDIELKNMEVIVFAMSDDSAFAISLCNRNIRNLRDQGYSSREYIYPVFYTLIKAMLTTGRLTKRHQEMYEEWQIGDKAYYGKLLDMVKAKYVS
jgi:hypothetical protein